MCWGWIRNAEYESKPETEPLTSPLETLKSAQVFKLELTATCRWGCEPWKPKRDSKPPCLELHQVARPNYHPECTWANSESDTRLPHDLCQLISENLSRSGAYSTDWAHAQNSKWLQAVGKPAQVPGRDFTSDWHMGSELSLLTAWGHEEGACGGGMFNSYIHSLGIWFKSNCNYNTSQENEAWFFFPAHFSYLAYELKYMLGTIRVSISFFFLEIVNSLLQQFTYVIKLTVQLTLSVS